MLAALFSIAKILAIMCGAFLVTFAIMDRLIYKRWFPSTAFKRVPPRKALYDYCSCLEPWPIDNHWTPWCKRCGFRQKGCQPVEDLRDDAFALRHGDRMWKLAKRETGAYPWEDNFPGLLLARENEP